MAQAGYTPIQLYYSTTASAAPSSGNLANGELAINITDGKLYYKDNGGTVRVLAGTGGTGVVAGSNTQVQFNNNGVFGASANLTFDGTTLTANALTVSNAVTLSAGTANGVAYLNGSKVVTTGSALTFTGSALGVNVATPLSALHVVDGNGVLRTFDNTDGIILTSYSASKSIGFSTSSAGNYGSDGGSNTFLKLTPGASGTMVFGASGSEQMRLTSTGLGIGTSSPGYRLDTLLGAGSGNIFRAGQSGVSNGYTITTNGSALTHIWANGGSDAMRLDSSGNLGLGVTPSAWAGSVSYAMQVGNYASVSSSQYYGGAYSSNSYYTFAGGGWKYISNDYATSYQQVSGQHRWLTAASGTAGAAITFTQAMTLDASGRLGVGTTSPGLKFQLQGGSSIADASMQLLVSGNVQNQISFSNGYGQREGVVFLGDGSSGNTSFGVISTQQALTFQTAAYNIGGVSDLSTGWTERARIDSSGNLSVGRTSGGGRVNIQANSNNFMNEFFNQSGGSVGSIQTNGTTTSYVTSSDYRLKENIQPMTGALAFVRKQRPVTYNWKADGSEGAGYIAHWMQEDGAGNCVTGTKDAVDAEGKPQYQGIDTSFMVAPLNAAINELADIVEAQAAIINQLKARLDAANL